MSSEVLFCKRSSYVIGNGFWKFWAISRPQLAGPSSPLPSSLDRLAVRLAPPRAPPSPSLSPPNSSSPPRASPSCSSLRAQLAARLVARQTELVRPAPLAAPDSRVTGVSRVLTACRISDTR
ncbi:hypothetical protein NL676_007259 [Syzygium grande]|nr:hypothetical protein NL676_007259 [Syzygium grande]